MVSKIEISHKTIIFTLFLLASIWMVWQIRDILYFLFIAFIIMSGLRPMVEAMVNKRVPRILAVVVVYIGIIGALTLTIASLVPAMIIQSTHLIQSFPSVIEKVLPFGAVNLGQFTQQIAPIGQNIIKVTINIFSNIITIVTILVFVFYFLLERKHTQKTLVGFIGEESANTLITILERIESRLGMWVQGQIILMLVIGVFIYIGLLILRIDFALPLAILAGLFEIVPNIGPIISAIPVIIVALATSPIQALSVVALFFIVHQLENNIIVPFVMKQSVGLSPLITIFALMVGGKLAGISGAVLAVPIVLVLQELLGAYQTQTALKK
jgi:predicted PurR-regulated permease PerM